MFQQFIYQQLQCHCEQSEAICIFMKKVTRTEWRKVKLGDVAMDVRDLYQPTKDEQLSYIGLEHIQPQALRLLEIGDSRQVQSTKKRFQAGDVLFGSLRVYFRKVVNPKFDGVCSTDITVLRPKNGRLDQKYLFYLVANNHFIDCASGQGEGTRMPRAGWSVISDFDLNIPVDVNEQKRIAEILSAFDEKIELNNKINQTLEQLAQAIFKEWFVNFRFPGHEKVEMVNSELGKIPKGWEVSNISKIKSQLRNSLVDGPFGTQMKIAEYTKQGVPVIEMEYLQDGYLETNFQHFISEQKFEYVKRSETKAGDIIISKTGTLGLIGIVPEEVGKAIIVSRLAKLTVDPQKTFTSFVYMHFLRLSNSGYWNSIASGSTMPILNLTHLNKISFVLPPYELQKRFDDLFSILYKQVLTNRKENKVLGTLRDLLLPKLMSGIRL